MEKGKGKRFKKKKEGAVKSKTLPKQGNSPSLGTQ
jgi:hypothetical protein